MYLSNLMPETHEGGEARITTEAAVEASEAAAVSAYNTVAGAVSDLISSFPSSKKDE